MINEDSVTAGELAQRLRIHRETVYLKAQSGVIPGFRVGRAWRFYMSEVRAALDASNPDPWARK